MGPVRGVEVRISRVAALLAALAAVGFGGWYLWKNRPENGQNAPLEQRQGGRLIVTYRTEPRSFNRFISPGAPEDLVTRLTHATLVRQDRTTATLEPRLAKSWTTSEDGLTWTFELRDDVAFPDGQPFTSTDVVFTFRALYDDRVKSEIASSFMAGNKPFQVRALGPHKVEIVCLAPFGVGISILDALPILPAHKLSAALDSGKFREAWSVTTPLTEIIGLGPFVLQQFVPGQRLLFRRNPRFWRSDEAGVQLPYVDEIELQFTPDQSAEVLRLKAGQSDLMTDRVRFDDLASLQDAAKEHIVTLHDAGISIAPDMLWFNLKPDAKVARAKPWLQREEFRHAVIRAVSRTAIVNQVFLGEAVEIAGPITPGHGEWFADDIPRPDFDPEQAERTLLAIGLADKDGDGTLEDATGAPVAFSLLVQKGHAVRERTSAVIQEQLRRVGIRVDVVAQDFRAVIGQWQSGEYEAIFHALEPDSFDPGRFMGFWLSSGPFHVWNAMQASASTKWEGQIDDLMMRQSSTIDQGQRRKLFADAQRVFSEHIPVLYFAAPKVTVASSARVQGVAASPIVPTVLWNAETLSLSDASSRRR